MSSYEKSPPTPLFQRGESGDAPLFMAVVKSNAYGHGLEETAKICSGQADWFGVDNIDEALTLREQGIKQPILILGYIPFDRVGEAVENDISFVAYNNELLDYLARLPRFARNDAKKKAKIHIKIETGISRQGIAGEELLAFVKKASKIELIFIEGIYTHYANIEDTTDPSYAMEQLKKFHENIKMLDEKIPPNPPFQKGGKEGKWSDGVIKHSACSAAFINYPETHFNMVRAGISLYGMWSSSETKAVARQKNVDLVLKPALTWKTQIAQIKKLPAGTPISYGLTETLKRDSIVGILPIGYWDGYDRGLSGIGEVLINGKRAKVLGRVCMNMTIVDLTDIPDAGLFNGVVLLGQDGKDAITAEELAKKINTINYEITTRINPLIKRIAR
jgi:alanine racemase